MFVMWKVSVDYDEVIRYKSRKQTYDLENDSDTSDAFANTKRLENTVYNF